MPTEIKILLCGLCGDQLHGHNKHGLVFNLGESRGGWGSSVNLVDFADVVCSTCATTAVHKLRTCWGDLLADLKDTRRPLVVSISPDGDAKIMKEKS